MLTIGFSFELTIVGLTASCFGLGATLSNLLGQMAVEKLGHVASLSGSFVLSLIPICLFALGMPETYGKRGEGFGSQQEEPETKPPVKDMCIT